MAFDYKSARWRRVRDSVLRAAGYRCQYFRRFGKWREADRVHHIWPAEDYPEYRWSDWNLISLASKTHNEMHDRNTNKLTDKGIELLKRTARKRGMAVPERYK